MQYSVFRTFAELKLLGSLFRAIINFVRKIFR